MGNVVPMDSKLASIQPDWLRYGQKTYALIWNNWYFRDFLAHKLAKYQYFFNSSVNLHILCLFQLNISLNMDFMAKKHQKVHKTGHISVFNFYPIAVTKKVSHPSFFNIFA